MQKIRISNCIPIIKIDSPMNGMVAETERGSSDV